MPFSPVLAEGTFPTLPVFTDWWFGGFPSEVPTQDRLAAESTTWGSVLGRLRPATTRVRDDSSFAGRLLAHGPDPGTGFCLNARSTWGF